MIISNQLNYEQPRLQLELNVSGLIREKLLFESVWDVIS